MADEKINVNKADADTLASLPGIGDTLAARIIEYRENNRPFEELAELTAVPGIDEELVQSIMESVSLVDKVVDINEANAKELAALNGIGEALAQRIIEFRESIHPFRETIELSAVSGISDDLVTALADKIKVSIVNVNKAAVDELVTLNGIGRTLAERIVGRRENAPFLTLNSLTEVSGISQRLVTRLMDQLTLGVDIEDRIVQNGHVADVVEEAAEETPEAAVVEAIDEAEEVVETAVSVTEEAVESSDEEAASTRTAMVDIGLDAAEEEPPLTEEIFTPEDVAEPEPEAETAPSDYAVRAGALAGAAVAATQGVAEAAGGQAAESASVALDAEAEAEAVVETAVAEAANAVAEAEEATPEIVEEVVAEAVEEPTRTATVEVDLEKAASEPEEVAEATPVLATSHSPEPMSQAAAVAAPTPVSTPVSNREENKPMSEITPDDTRSSSPPPPARTQVASRSGGGSWMTILFASVFGALGGAILTILILATLNGGTLRFAQATQGVQNEINAVRQSQLDMTTGVDTLSAEINNLGSNVEVMGANMAEMEANMDAALSTVQDDLGVAQGSIVDLETTTTELGAEVAEVAESAETFDSFLGGLRDLLFDVTGPPEGMVPAGDAGVVVTATVPAPPTPTPFATLAPSGLEEGEGADEAEEAEEADEAEAGDETDGAAEPEGEEAGEGEEGGEEEPAAEASPTPFSTIAPTRTPQPTSTPFPTATPRP